jgi:hypothetical protein
MMMKKTIMGLIAATALISASAMAGDVTAEYRNASNDTNQYKVEASNTVGNFKLIGEAETTQVKGHGKVTETFAGSVGYKFSVQNYAVTPFVQVVEKLNVGTDDQQLYGVGVKVSRPVIGSLVADAEYRYRANLDKVTTHENREKLGLTWNVTAHHAIGAAFYVYSGSSAANHREGVFYKYTF